MLTPLSQNERIALGEAWMPIFVEYFSGENSKWVMVALSQFQYCIENIAQRFNKRKKKKN